MRKVKNSTFAGFGEVSSTDKDYRPTENPPLSINSSLKQKSISVDDLSATINYLVGKVCTVIDASVVDKEQATAIKQIIKDDMYGAVEKVKDWKLDNDSAEELGIGGSDLNFPFWK